MSINGWLQIAIYCVLLILIAKPFGGYMTRVFNGERTVPARPCCGRSKRGIYRLRGVRRGRGAALDRLRRRDAGIQLRRFRRACMPPASAERAAAQPAGLAAVSPDLAFNTSVSFVTNTNWQSYVPETTMSYLSQMVGADGAQLRLGRDRHRAGDRADPRVRPPVGADHRQFLGRYDPLRALHPAADLRSSSAWCCRLAGRAAEPRPPTPRSRRWKAPSRSSPRDRWPRRKSSRCWAPTAAASSTPTRRIRSRIPRR